MQAMLKECAKRLRITEFKEFSGCAILWTVGSVSLKIHAWCHDGVGINWSYMTTDQCSEMQRLKAVGL